MTPPPVFDEADRCKCRLWKIVEEVICPLLIIFLTWVTPDWDQTIGFLTYLSNKNVGTDQLENMIYGNKLDILKMGPAGVSKWDTTLVYSLLTNCEGLLAGKHDKAWSSKSVQEPECLIRSLKVKRNITAHEKVNRKDFFKEVEEIRTLMEKAILSVGKKCPHVSKKDIDTNLANFDKKLNEIRDANIGPETWNEYKKELYYSEQIALIQDKGVSFLKNALDRKTTITPLSLIMKGVEMQVPVYEIFSEIQLEEDGKNEEILLENLFQVSSGSDVGSFILLKGHAGMGKSTLVKKITSDWVNRVTSIEGLCSFDLLFYAELRDNVATFSRLLRNSLGEKVYRSFRDEDLLKAVLGLKTLVILDGYDELNQSSFRLFQELLELNECHSQLTLIVTTRPEAEEKLKSEVESKALNALHLRLVGIKANKREQFVTKYFKTLHKDSKDLRHPDKLCEFLRETEHKMSIVWEITYNLCLLTILWMFKPNDVNRITTEAELYWQIFLLSISKLEERLYRNQSIHILKPSILKNKIEQFLVILSRESLNGLKDDLLYLPKLVYEKLNASCLTLGVPVEELAGAFLKKVTSMTNTYYTFPHKGFMEFMGAYCIYKQVTRPDADQLSMKEWSEELSKSCIPSYVQFRMLDLYEAEATKEVTVEDILKSLHGGSLPDSLEKYQNLLIQTLSIFHVGESQVPEAAKIKTLELLQKSGLKDKESILKVMHNIKCTNEVARRIAEKFRLFDSKTLINLSSIDAYTALLAATDPPLQNIDDIKIDIILEDTSSVFKILSKHLCRHELYPRQIFFNNHFEKSSSPNSDETDSIKNLLSKDCARYKGIWSPTFQMPSHMENLEVNLLDHLSLEALCASLEENTKITYLAIHFSVNDVSSVSRPIPFLKNNPRIWVYVSDVKVDNIEKVGDILRALQPQDLTRPIYSIRLLQRSPKSPEEFLLLPDSLKGVRVRWDISFPGVKRPLDDDFCEEMDRKIKASTGCKFGIRW